MEKVTFTPHTITKLLLTLDSELSTKIDSIIVKLFDEYSDKDLSLLKLSVYIKRERIKNGFGSKLNFAVDINFVLNSLQQCDDRSLEDYLQTYAIFLSMHTNQINLLTDIIKYTDSETENYKTVKNLRFLISILEVISPETVSTYILPLADVIVKLMSSDSTEIIALICYSLLPIYFKLTNNYKILDDILINIKNSKNYRAICCLNTYIFTSKSENYRISDQIWFWDLIKHGLTSDDITVRKCSLYLLKNSVCESNNSYAYTSQFQKKDSDLKKCWENFILLYESLDEKQSHIITPGFRMFEFINNLDSTWQVILYKRLIEHENSNVQHFGIDAVLQKDYTSLQDEQFFHAILKDFTRACNNSYLFQRDNFELKSKLKIFLANLKKNNLLEYFIKSCSDLESSQWLSVPFFHIIHCLVEIGHCRITDEVGTIQKFINISEKILNTYIRNALQCLLLNYIQKLYSPKTLNKAMILQMCYLMNKCSVQMNSLLWNKCVKYLRPLEYANKDDILNVDMPAKIILLFYDAKVISKNELYNLLNSILTNFENISTRYNFNVTKYDNMLIFLNNFFEDVDKSDDLKFKNEMFECMKSSKWNLYSYIKRNILSGEVIDFKTISIYLNFCKIVLTHIFDTRIIFNCDELLQNNSSIVIKYFSLSILDIIVKNSSNVDYICKICNIVDKIPALNAVQNDFSDQDNFRKFITGYYQVLNSIETSCIRYTMKLNYTNLDKISSQIFQSLEIGGRESLVNIMELIKFILPDLIYTKTCDINRVIKICWTETMQLKKCDLFWSAIQQFIKTFFKTDLLLNDNYSQEIIQYGYLILEQSNQMRGLARVFYDQILVVVMENNSGTLRNILMPFVIQGLTFGPIWRRDERIELETTKVIKSLEHVHLTSTVENKFLMDSVVRVRSIEILTKMIESPVDQNQKIFLDQFIECLIVDYNTENRPRYFADSKLHHFKTRYFQVLLYLQRFLDEKQTESIFKFLCYVLQNESPQASVRYLMEWLFIIILYTYPHLILEIKEKINEFASNRISSLVSIISVVYHLAVLDPSKFLSNATIIILPLTMTSNFCVRLYSQVALLWLLKKNDNAQESHRAIYNSLNQILNQENVCKPYEKLRQDFFFTNFHPIEHLTIETIYCHIPRLTNLSEEELDLNYFDTTIVKNIFNRDKLLDQHSAVISSQKDAQERIEDLSTSTNIYQKKIMPWKTLMPEMQMISKSIDIKKKSCGDLIVVATLIDRAPNLGGLSRTCEIFGVKEYVINSLKHMESKEFQNLSVSAEKWLQITEVQLSDLTQYLLEMKKENYTIIGCEQSTDSIQLNVYQFPKKTVLLLGNEKEGISPNLLALIDVCIEIPQCGVVRSLNVHVSGALTIWQYACQHLLSGEF